MSLISDIEKIKKETFWIGLSDLLFLIVPGFLLFFIFNRDIFLILDPTKLTLLSFSFTAPFVLINVFCLMLFEEEGARTGDRSEITFLEFTLGIFFTNIIFFIVLFISYLLSLSFKNVIVILTVVELFILILSIISSIWKYKGKKAQKA